MLQPQLAFNAYNAPSLCSRVPGGTPKLLNVGILGKIFLFWYYSSEEAAKIAPFAGSQVQYRKPLNP